ncbi:hypothetical protein Asp14428_79510 [Actinoplanes sp. NBRC 14428]|nr:hypothetical protein Asp14428_79510 [Actinoplanes sp. NBRC 14428]
MRAWHDDEGWGIIDSPDTPGGCWTHFSSILSDGYRTLTGADQVTFEFEQASQDGYAYRTTAVWTGPERPKPPTPGEPSAAFTSTLRLDFD